MSAAPQIESSTHKSTNVRSRRGPAPPPRWLVGGVKALATLSPQLAGDLVAPLFFRARRGTKTTPEQRRVFDMSRRRPLREGLHQVQTYAFGEGERTALLVHGWNGRAAQLAHFVEPLLDNGWRVIAFDALGHGDSGGTGSSLPGFARTLARVAHAYGGVDAVVAHSLGAASAMVAMADGLRVERAAMLAPPSSPLPWIARFGHFLELDAPTLDGVKAGIERRGGKRLDELHGPSLVRGLEARALIVHDRDDREVPITSGEAIHYAWPGSRLVVTAGLGHNRILRDPEVVESVRRFLSPGASGTD